MPRAVAFMLVLSLGAAACGSTSSATRATGPRGSITVFAAASLTEPFTDEQVGLARRYPSLSVAYDFAGSQTLAQQIEQGAPADVLASADRSVMQTLVDAGLVETPRVFARNQLVIAVAPGNPKHISGLADLSRADVAVVLADPSVPAGKYARQMLAKAGATVTPKSLELDVKAALAKVMSGEADAAIVYVTDVRSAEGKATAVTVPDQQNVVATYPIAIVKATKHRAAARAFVDDIVHGNGQLVLRARGFLPAT